MDQDSRRKLRGLLRSILQGEDLRRRLRQALFLNVVLFLLGIILFIFFVKTSLFIYFTLFLREENLFTRFIRDSSNRHQFIAIRKSASTSELNRDWDGIHRHLDLAEEGSSPTYSAYLRAGILSMELHHGWQDPDTEGKEKIFRFYEALRRGSQNDPVNLLWPILEAGAKALEGKGREGLDLLMEEASRRETFNFPSPRGSHRDLVGLGELFFSMNIRLFPVMDLRPLTVQAVQEARRGDVTPAREYNRFLERASRLILQEFQEARDPLRGDTLLLSARGILTNRYFLVSSLPNLYSERERELARNKAAAADGILDAYRSNDIMIYFILLLVIAWSLMGISVFPLLAVLLGGILTVLKIPKPRVIDWIAIRLELKNLHWITLAGSVLGIWAFLTTRFIIDARTFPLLLSAGFFIIFLGLVFFSFRSSVRLSWLARKAGRGAWNGKSRRSPFGVPGQLSFCTLFLTKAILALTLLTFIPPREYPNFGDLLQSPERSLVASLSSRDRKFSEEYSGFFSAIHQENDPDKFGAVVQMLDIKLEGDLLQQALENFQNEIDATK